MRRPTLAALALASLAAACSEDAPAPQNPPAAGAPAAIVALQGLGPGPHSAPQGTPLEWPEPSAAGRYLGSPSELVADGAVRALRLAGEGRWTVTLAAPPRLREFEGLGLAATCSGRAQLTLKVEVRAGTRSARGEPGRLALDGAGRASLHCALPQRLPAGGAAELALEFSGDAGDGVLLAPPVLAQRAPPEMAQSLASAESAETPILLGVEHRPGRVLRPGRRLLGRSRSPSADARLALGLGALETPGQAPASFTLRVRIRAEGAAEREEALAFEQRGAWRTQVLPLGVAAGEPFELEFEVECPPGAFALAAVADPLVYAPRAEPPLVVLITSDTHRGDHLEGASGAVAIRTPALRELAARGVEFDDCYSSTNVTLPSHAALMTGASPRDTGVTDNRSALVGAATTLAELFRGAGFHTCATTSLNLLSLPYSGVGQGFERMSTPPTTRSSEKTVELALRWLDECPDRPVFLWLHVFDAHGPYQPPPPFDRAFYPAGKDPADPSIEREPGMLVPSYRPDVRDADFIRALYGGEIAYEDQQLARFLAHPRVRAGVLAFTGDHGEVLGRHGIWWAHKDVYPDTLHVPLILAWPGAPAGKRVSEPVLNVDVGRTLLDLAGLGALEFPGRDLARFDAPPAPGPRFALAGARREASINAGGWHLILQLRTGAEDDADGHVDRRALHQVELFRLADDPGCERDLSEVERDRARDLRAQLVAWLGGWRGSRLAERPNLDAAAQRNLAALGYASGAGGAESEGPLIDPQCSCAQCARWR